MATADWRDRFIQHLEQLRERNDRGALAILRRGIGHPPGTVSAMYPLVVPWVPEQKYAEDATFLVAALFALHPLAGGQGTLGAAFARIGKESGSIEQRFVALLNCHHDDLPDYLRQAISLLRSKDVPVDWRRCLQDVLSWDHESRYVQRAWARDFWRSAPTAEANETETEATE